MNYFNYPYNYYFVSSFHHHPLYQPMQPLYYHRQPLYQPIQPLYCRRQRFQPLHPYYKQQTQLVNVTQRQPYMETGCTSSLQQDTADQEQLRDTIIAVMKQSNNKLCRVLADAADLKQSENPVEYILKAATILKEILTTNCERL